MDIEHLRLRADALRHFLAGRKFTLSHNQALDFLAAAAGLRNWPEVNAFPDKVAAASMDERAAARLAKRILTKGGPAVQAQELLQLLLPEKVQLRLAVWEEGPPPGIYVTLDAEAVAAAIGHYAAGSHDSLFFTSGMGWVEGNAIDLGDQGIFSAGLQRAPTGTLVVMQLSIGAGRWEDLKDRMTAAWNAAAAGMRVIVACSTPTPDSLYSDVSLLTHTQGEPGPDETNWLSGIVTSNGELRQQSPFVPARPAAPAISTLPPSKLSLPDSVATFLEEALAGRKTGIVVAGMLADVGENQPLEVIAAMLPRLAKIGAIGRIPRHNPYDGQHEVPDAVAVAPVYASVESAIAAGCAVIVFDMAFYDETQEILQCIDQALFVVGVKALSVGRGISTVLPAAERMPALVDHVTAAICTGKVRGKASKPMTWDMYIRVEGLVARSGQRKKPQDLEAMFEAARVVRREDQIAQWLADGVVTEKSVAKDYPYLRLPKPAVAAAR